MICPVFSKDGSRRRLSTLKYDDLIQLEVVDEGYAVEYKSSWDKNVKKELPKEIAAFANAGGGWIFVGVDNDGKLSPIANQSRTDFGQVVGQLVKRHISPIPEFDCRFVQDPADGGRGVLVIEVREGVIPPYVSNGRVYVRTGSSAENYSQPADNFMLVDLHRKARDNQEAIDEFCHRTVYLPPTLVRNGVRVSEVPTFDVYLKRLYPEHGRGIPFSELDAVKVRMGEFFEDETGMKCVCHPAHRSLLFRKKISSPVDEIAPVLELFYDGSMKICIPIIWAQSQEAEEAVERLRGIRSIGNAMVAKVIDGRVAMGELLGICGTADRYLRFKGRTIADFAVTYEFENMQGSFVEFKTKGFADYVRDNGFLFVGTVDERPKPRLFEHTDDSDNPGVKNYAIDVFFQGCGIPLLTADDEWRDKVLRLMLGDEAVDALAEQDDFDSETAAGDDEGC